MKKFLVILTVVLTNMFSVVACPVNNFKINDNIIAYSDESKNNLLYSDSLNIKYDKMNFTPIYRYLQLEDNQYEDFYRIHKDIYQSINYLEDHKEDGVKVFNNHIKNNLRDSYWVLNKQQYHKYLIVLNVTLANRNLNQYIIK